MWLWVLCKKKKLYDRNISEHVPSAISFQQEKSFIFFLPTKPSLLSKVIIKLKREGRHKIKAFQYLVYSCYFRVITSSPSILTFAATPTMLAKMHSGMLIGSTAVKERQRMSDRKEKQTEEFLSSCSSFHLPPYPDSRAKEFADIYSFNSNIKFYFCSTTCRA